MAKTEKKIKHNYLRSICENIASLSGILAIVLVFHVFIAKGSVIPTGSMADNLRGDHFHLTCPVCGYEYNFGFVPQKYRDVRTGMGWPEGYRPRDPVPLVPPGMRSQSSTPICPMCEHPAENDHNYFVRRGDQIWVMKCYYQFFEPKRWNIAVLKNPTDPKIDYIKRIVGCPGETLEIIDGDIYVNGLIQQKPDRVQDVMWLGIFDSRYQPIQTTRNSQRQQRRYPFIPLENADAWQIVADHQQFIFKGSDQEQSLQFDPIRLKYSLAGQVPYNGPLTDQRYKVSDLKLTCRVQDHGESGELAMVLGKYDRNYRATVNFNGDCSIEDLFNQTVLIKGQCPVLNDAEPVDITFSNVDHRLMLRINDQVILLHDGPNAAADWGYEPNKMPKTSEVFITAQGQKITLTNIALFRDAHYTNHPWGTDQVGLGTEGHPITLQTDQFFVCGDNSPNSLDGRFWDAPGKTNGDTPIPQGVVPRDYLIGKPLFVYWPGAFRLNEKLPLPIIPNTGEMRFIH